MVNVNGTDRDLQYVFDNHFFNSDLRDRKGLVFADPSSIHHGKHQASEILVSSDGKTGTLLNYLRNKTLPSGFSRNYSIPTHPATMVFFSSGKSLQELVDAGGKFTCTYRRYCEGTMRLERLTNCRTRGISCGGFGCSPNYNSSFDNHPYGLRSCNPNTYFPHSLYLDAYMTLVYPIPGNRDIFYSPDEPTGPPLPAPPDSGSCSAGWVCNGSRLVYRMSNCSISYLYGTDCFNGCYDGNCKESFAECGDEINECDSGVWADRQDTNNYHSWFCGGRPCVKEKPAVKGTCNNNVVNGCRQGDPFSSLDNSTHYKWNCWGLIGGPDSCSKAKSLASPSCNFRQQGCNSGNYRRVPETYVNLFYLENRWNCYNSRTCVGCRKSLFSSGTFSC